MVLIRRFLVVCVGLVTALGALTVPAGAALPGGVQVQVGLPLNAPHGVAVSSSGDVFVADTGNNRVIKITPAGSLSTVGTGFSSPQGVALDSSGDVFVANTGNNQVVKITPAGAQSTVGSGFASPQGVAVDSSGDVFVANTGNNQVVKITPAGARSTVGSGLSRPTGVALDSSGDVVVADTGNNQVVKVTPAGAQSVLDTHFASPAGVAVDSSGDVFVANTGNNQVVKITPTGAQSTMGSGFASPQGVAVDSSGDVFVADTGNNQVVKITPSGTQSTVGSGFAGPTGVAVDSSGDVFVANTGNNQVVKITPAGSRTTLGAHLSSPHGVAVDAAGNVYVSSTGTNQVIKITPAGAQSTVGSGFAGPTGVAVDSSGDVYVADTGHNRVVEVTPANRQLVIGSGFSGPRGVAVDATHDVFVADTHNNRIEELGAVTVPSAPRLLSVRPVAAGFSANWMAPTSTGGTSLLGYTITARPTTGRVITKTVAANVTSTTVTGLASSITYIVTVSANNSLGASLNSNSLFVTTLSNGGPPPAPARVDVSVQGSNTVVTWSAPPSDGGFALTGYEVGTSPATSATGGTLLTSTPLSASQHSLSVTGLAPSFRGYFFVAAVNSRGVGARQWRYFANGRVPYRPARVIVSAAGADAVVQWSAPTNDGGFPVTGYEVRVTSAKSALRTGGTLLTSTPLSASQHSFVVHNVAIHFDGYFVVSALNARGEGDRQWRHYVNPLVPWRPARVNVSVQGRDTILTWTVARTANGFPVTGYEIGVVNAKSQTGGRRLDRALVAPTHRRFVVANLGQHFRGYFYVAALNAHGVGYRQWRYFVNGRTPLFPRDVYARRVGTNVVVTWGTPADSGGFAITGYKVGATTTTRQLSHGGIGLSPVLRPSVHRFVVRNVPRDFHGWFFVAALNARGTGLRHWYRLR
ncbi:MAG: fibronectin type III domain-containing protein [Acidobacteriota bacterium]|nr:fibronectin type III domain-containing protein [Acidobacteriota bacterium]